MGNSASSDWLKGLFSDTLSKTLSNILSGFFTVLFAAILTLSLAVVSTMLQKPIAMPLYVFVIICLFALIGVLIPSKKIYDYLKNLKPKEQNSRIIGEVKFEEEPRVWRSHCFFDFNTWNISGSEVYCTEHNLKLELHPMTINQNDYMVSRCPDCAKEGIYYYAEDMRKHFPVPPGCAVHTERENGNEFLTEVRNRILREISTT